MFAVYIILFLFCVCFVFFFFFSSRRRHTRYWRDWSSDVCSSDLRSPCSSAVLAVAGPMQAITVTLCGLPAMPTRFRTVEEEVNRTASKPPPLMRSEERRVGKECRARRAPYKEKRNRSRREEGTAH